MPNIHVSISDHDNRSSTHAESHAESALVIMRGHLYKLSHMLSLH